MNVVHGNFEWWKPKETENRRKHKVGFETATLVFNDPDVIVEKDTRHSTLEEIRWYAIGRPYFTPGERGSVLTVRFTVRSRIRILGAGYWRKNRNRYEDHLKEQGKAFP